jgi:hypothetical protein
VLFKDPPISPELFRVHPELRRVLFELDAKIDGWGFPPLTVTHLARTVAQQEEFYWRTFSGLPEAAAREKARRKFSWHLCLCAADLRHRDYSPEQAAQITAWVQERCASPLWELLVEETTGTGPHFHLGRRDYEWRRKYEQQTKVSTGAV